MNHPILNSSNVVAAGAIVSPIWLPDLESVSILAAQVLPILGVLWLAIQIGFYLYGKFK